MTYVLFIVGFVFLIRGAGWLVEGGSSLGRRLGLPELLIGLTIVAFGTSLPELIVNLFASQQSGDLAMANVVGSNIANILLILGIAAMIHPLTVHRTVVYREIIFNIIASIMLAILVADNFIGNHGGFAGLDKIDGIVLMSYFVLFLYYSFGKSNLSVTAETSTEEVNIPRAFFMIMGGILGLFFGGQWIVDGAVEVATTLGVSDALIGSTIVAVGTSLPELAASVVAARRGQVDIAIGNAVGSNLFNILWVLGLGAIIRPIAINHETFLDIYIAIIVALMLFMTMVFGRFRHQISRSEGRLFIVLYIAYLAIAVMTGTGTI
jgi:cation:H+ antiporter